MPYGLYISAEGAYAQDKRLEVIANNLANLDTVGFKRELAVFQARYAEAVEQGLQIPGFGSIEDLGGGILIRETKTDFSPGPLKDTGKPADVAIPGEGFFVVQKGEETFLTRAGNFRVAADGRLTTQQGYDVLDDAAAPIILRDPDWKISATGVVQQEGVRQNLALVKPESLDDLVKMGENLFRSTTEPLPIPVAQRRVAPGYLEASGVKATSEMTAMIEAARLLEANVNLMKTQDEMLGGLVNRAMRV